MNQLIYMHKIEIHITVSYSGIFFIENLFFFTLPIKGWKGFFLVLAASLNLGKFPIVMKAQENEMNNCEPTAN